MLVFLADRILFYRTRYYRLLARCCLQSVCLSSVCCLLAMCIIRAQGRCRGKSCTVVFIVGMCRIAIFKIRPEPDIGNSVKPSELTVIQYESKIRN